MKELIIELIILVLMYIMGLFVGYGNGRPTELPNDCILHKNAIYCMEVSE